MEHMRNGDFKVRYEQELFGRRRNNTLPACLDLTSEAINAGPARVPLPPKSSTSSRRRTYADGELDVFSAERYFKGAIDYDHKEGSAEPVETVARPTVPLANPAWTCASAVSAGSGASANSQTVLLRDARRRPGYLGKKCCLQVGELLRPCSGKRAVRIDDGGVAKEVAEASKTAASRIEWHRDLRMEKANLDLAGEGNRGVVASGIHPNLSLGGATKVAAIGREEKAAEYMSASFTRGSFTLQAPVKVSGGGGGGRHDDDDSHWRMQRVGLVGRGPPRILEKNRNPPYIQSCRGTEERKDDSRDATYLSSAAAVSALRLRLRRRQRPPSPPPSPPSASAPRRAARPRGGHPPPLLCGGRGLRHLQRRGAGCCLCDGLKEKLHAAVLLAGTAPTPSPPSSSSPEFIMKKRNSTIASLFEKHEAKKMVVDNLPIEDCGLALVCIDSAPPIQSDSEIESDAQKIMRL